MSSISEKRKNLPNILLIHADQHRADCLGVYGNSDIKTPHIDSLAKDGITYKNCFATFPLCTPSRYSLLTGLYTHQHLGWTNHSTIPNGLHTFPRMLKKQGYNTKCVGKMHYTPTYVDVGYDDMVLAEQDGPGRYDDDYHRYLKEEGLVDYIDLQDQVYEYRSHASKEYYENFGTDPSNLDEKHHSTTWIADRAVETVEKWDEGGNMLFVGFIKPHHPHDAPKPWCDMYVPEKLELLPGWTDECLDVDLKFRPGYFDNKRLTPESIKRIMAQYYGAISQIDFHVGRLIDILKEKGLYENTMIIYTSDHGDFMGYHHMVLKGNYMYDPVIRVPLIVKFPQSYIELNDMEPGNIVNNELVSVIDTTASIMDVADCMIPQDLWGLIQPLEEDTGRDFVFAESVGNYMYRTKERKLLLNQSGKSQFFNIIDDPAEKNNLFNHPDYKDEVKEYKNMLFEFLAFEGQSRVHVNEHDNVCKAENVPKFDDGHWNENFEYYKQKMTKFQEK